MSYYNGKIYTKPGTFKFEENKPYVLKRDCTINQVRVMEQDEWFDELEMFRNLGFVNDEGYIVIPAGTIITLLPALPDQYSLRSFMINNTSNNIFTCATQCNIDGLLADAVLNTPEVGKHYSVVC